MSASIERKSNRELAVIIQVAASGDIKALQDLKRTHNIDITAVSEGESLLTQAFFEALRSGKEVPVLRTLIQAGADITKPNKEGSYALHVAVEETVPTQSLLFLLNETSFKQNLNSLSNAGATALTESLRVGNVTAALRLIEAGADVNAAAPGTFTPLHMLALDPKLTYLIRSLLTRGARNSLGVRTMHGFTPLTVALDQGNDDFVKQLIRQAPEVLTQNDILHRVIDGKSSIEMIEYLLTTNALKTLDSPDGNGRTPLMIALRRGRIDVARLLIKSGAEPNMMDHDGIMALSYAVRGGFLDIVDLLLGMQKVKKEVNTVDAKKHLTPFILSLDVYEHLSDPIMPRFLERLEETRRRNDREETVRQERKRDFDPKMTDAYLEKAASTARRTKEERKLFYDNRNRISMLIANAGGNVTTPTKDGITPLHVAVSRTNHAMVEFILSKSKASIDAPIGSESITPLALARDPMIARLLIQAGASVSTNTLFYVMMNSSDHFSDDERNDLDEWSRTAKFIFSKASHAVRCETFSRALAEGRTIVLERLLSAGLKLDSMGNNGKTLLEELNASCNLPRKTAWMKRFWNDIVDKVKEQYGFLDVQSRAVLEKRRESLNVIAVTSEKSTEIISKMEVVFQELEGMVQQTQRALLEKKDTAEIKSTLESYEVTLKDIKQKFARSVGYHQQLVRELLEDTSDTIAGQTEAGGNVVAAQQLTEEEELQKLKQRQGSYEELLTYLERYSQDLQKLRSAFQMVFANHPNENQGGLDVQRSANNQSNVQTVVGQRQEILKAVAFTSEKSTDIISKTEVIFQELEGMVQQTQRALLEKKDTTDIKATLEPYEVALKNIRERFTRSVGYHQQLTRELLGNTSQTEAGGNVAAQQLTETDELQKLKQEQRNYDELLTYLGQYSQELQSLKLGIQNVQTVVGQRQEILDAVAATSEKSRGIISDTEILFQELEGMVQRAQRVLLEKKDTAEIKKRLESYETALKSIKEKFTRSVGYHQQLTRELLGNTSDSVAGQTQTGGNVVAGQQLTTEEDKLQRLKQEQGNYNELLTYLGQYLQELQNLKPGLQMAVTQAEQQPSIISTALEERKNILDKVLTISEESTQILFQIEDILRGNKQSTQFQQVAVNNTSAGDTKATVEYGHGAFREKLMRSLGYHQHLIQDLLRDTSNSTAGQTRVSIEHAVEEAGGDVVKAQEIIDKALRRLHQEQTNYQELLTHLKGYLNEVQGLQVTFSDRQALDDLDKQFTSLRQQRGMGAQQNREFTPLRQMGMGERVDQQNQTNSQNNLNRKPTSTA